MAKYYAPNFSGLLPLFDGVSAAGGKLCAYRAGTSIPAPLFDEDGVELGSWVSIDSNGCADFLLDSALSYKLVAKDALGAVVGEWDNVKATNAPGGMDNPMTASGDIIVGGEAGTASRLAAPGALSFLQAAVVSGVGNVLRWAKLLQGTGVIITEDADGNTTISATGGGGGSVETMQENFSLLDSTDHYDTSTRGNRIYASKVVSNFTATRTKLGFFHEAGALGAVLLGVYDNAGNLLATTAAETPTSETFKKMRWIDTAAPFDMVAGAEYYFVAYFTEAPWSLTIDALGMEKTSTFDANFIGSASASAGLSALPATLPALTPDSLAFYIAAR